MHDDPDSSSRRAQLRFDEDEDEDKDGDAIDGIRSAALVVLPLYLLLALLIWWRCDAHDHQCPARSLRAARHGVGTC
jgi:hypothetical protein